MERTGTLVCSFVAPGFVRVAPLKRQGRCERRKESPLFHLKPDLRLLATTSPETWKQWNDEAGSGTDTSSTQNDAEKKSSDEKAGEIDSPSQSQHYKENKKDFVGNDDESFERQTSSRFHYGEERDRLRTRRLISTTGRGVVSASTSVKRRGSYLSPPNSETLSEQAASVMKNSQESIADNEMSTRESVGRYDDIVSKKLSMRVLTAVKYPGMWALGTYGAYLLIGCTYYMVAEAWTFADAMYFTIQTGLGVGYGDLVPSSNASMLFTSGYVLLGNVFFAAALALFVEAEFKNQDARNPQGHSEDSDEFGSRVDTTSLRGSALLLNDLRILWKTLRNASLSDTFSAAFEYVYLDKEQESDNQRGVGLLRRDIRRFFTNFRKSIIGKAAFSYALLASWIGLGVGYGYFIEHYQLPYSILFSVSCITTFGIVPPPSSHESRIFNLIFTAIGFAIYLNSVGKIAGVLVEQYELEKRQIRAENNKLKFGPKLLNWVWKKDQLAREHDVQAWNEYLEMELIKKGVVDDAMLRRIRTEFEETK